MFGWPQEGRDWVRWCSPFGFFASSTLHLTGSKELSGPQVAQVTEAVQKEQLSRPQMTRVTEAVQKELRGFPRWAQFWVAAIAGGAVLTAFSWHLSAKEKTLEAGFATVSAEISLLGSEISKSKNEIQTSMNDMQSRLRNNMISIFLKGQVRLAYVSRLKGYASSNKNNQFGNLKVHSLVHQMNSCFIWLSVHANVPERLAQSCSSCQQW